LKAEGKIKTSVRLEIIILDFRDD